jgi:hypothetical protein
MPTLSLADYITLTEQGETFMLAATQEKRFDITIPSDYASSHRVLLGYIVYPGAPFITVRYDIDVNDVVVHDGASLASSDNYNVRWRVIEGDKLSIGPNSIQFRVLEGLTIFSDVVLWFQQKVTTP